MDTECPLHGVAPCAEALSDDTATATTTDQRPEFSFATEYGSDGPYYVGVEYTVDAEHVHHLVRRPMRTETFVGYGLTDRVGRAVTRISHDGEMSAWRIRLTYGGPIEVMSRPMSPPYLNIPDEEHGADWGADIDVPSTEPVCYEFAGREVTEDEAMAAIAAFTAAHPTEQRPVTPARAAGGLCAKEVK